MDELLQEIDDLYELVAMKIKEYLPETFQDAQIMVDNIYKPGNVRTGITVLLPLESITPVIYLEDAYQKYMNGQWTENEVLRSAADDVVRLHQQAARMEENPMLLKDYESYAAMLQPELLNKSQDPAFLEKYAYTYEQPDCIAAYTALLNDHMKMRITNEMLDAWGISKEALRENAIQKRSDEHLFIVARRAEGGFGQLFRCLSFVAASVHDAHVIKLALDNSIVPAANREVELQAACAAFVERLHFMHFKALLQEHLTHGQPQRLVAVRRHAHAHYLSGIVVKTIFIRAWACELLTPGQSDRHDRNKEFKNSAHAVNQSRKNNECGYYSASEGRARKEFEFQFSPLTIMPNA